MEPNHAKRDENQPKAEYSVQFECISNFLVYFEDAVGLTDHQIVERALQIARNTFNNGGSIMVERASREGSYALVALGIDSQSAHILGKPVAEKPRLRVVK